MIIRRLPTCCRYTMRLDGTTLFVAPEPFGGRTVAISIDAREIPHRPFTSAEDVRQLVDTAPTITLAGFVTGTSRS